MFKTQASSSFHQRPSSRGPVCQSNRIYKKKGGLFKSQISEPQLQDTTNQQPMYTLERLKKNPPAPERPPPCIHAKKVKKKAPPRPDHTPTYEQLTTDNLLAGDTDIVYANSDNPEENLYRNDNIPHHNVPHDNVPHDNGVRCMGDSVAYINNRPKVPPRPHSNHYR